MAAMLPDDASEIREFDRGGNVFTRVGAASVSAGYSVLYFLSCLWSFVLTCCLLLYDYSLTSDVENLYSNGHWHDEYLCQVSLKSLH